MLDRVKEFAERMQERGRVVRLGESGVPTSMEASDEEAFQGTVDPHQIEAELASRKQ